MPTTINIIIFGIEKTGSQLINQIIDTQIPLQKQDINLSIPVIANESVAFFEKEGIKNKWEANFLQFAIPYNVSDIIHYIKSVGLTNLIAVDTTSNRAVINDYPELLNEGFDVITINENYQKSPLKLNFQINNVFENSVQKLYEIIPATTQDPVKDVLEQIISIGQKTVAKSNSSNNYVTLL